MKDQEKTKEKLIVELTNMRQKMAQLEALQNEHRKLEYELQKIKTVFDTMIDGVTITDMEGSITDINKATTAQLGYTYEEAIGKTPGELFIAERDRAKFLLKEHPHAVSARPISASEYIVKHKNGREFSISVNISSLRDPDGTPIGVVAVHRDITKQKDAQEKLKNAKDELERRVKERTSALVVAIKQLRDEINERKRTDKALQKSEERFRLTFENAKDAIFWADSETGSIIQCNKAAETLLNRKKEELIGTHQSTLHPPQKRKFYSEMFQSHIAKRGAIDEEAEIITKPGEIKTVQISASLIDIRGKSIIQGIFHDITERKNAEEALRQSEEKYRNIFEDSRDAIYMTTRDGKFVEVNNSCLDIFGYEKEEMIGMDVMKIYVNPSDRKEFQKRIEKNGFVRDYSVKLRKKGGAKRDCLITSTVRRNSGGTILGYQGIIRDITEKKRMEREAQKVQKLESIGILAGGITHDFNNILMGISGNISLAKFYTNAGNPIFERLLEMEEGISQAKDLTQQFLTFSKGGAPIKKTTSIREIIEVSANFTLRGSNCQCKFFIPDDLWPVEVDKGQISQVMNNLIMNAKEALPEGGIIKVYAENTVVHKRGELPLKEGNYIKVSIEDQGHGISKKNLSKIFDPYFTTRQKGNGLGLSVTYSIIKSHDGYIKVESEVGIGTTFHIFLRTSKKETHSEETDKEMLILGKGKIMVMDDEEVIREVTKEMLELIGYEVSLARDGVETLELFKQARESGHPFDAIIMDLTIPGGMGGKQTIMEILKIDPEVKAIVSSGYCEDPIISNFTEHGFSDSVAKPYKIQELSRKLHALITDVSE